MIEPSLERHVIHWLMRVNFNDMENSIIKIFKNEKLILLFISLFFSIFLISNIHFPGIWNDEAAVGETANQISRVIHYGGSLPRIGYIHPEKGF